MDLIVFLHPGQSTGTCLTSSKNFLEEKKKKPKMSATKNHYIDWHIYKLSVDQTLPLDGKAIPKHQISQQRKKPT